MSKTKYGYRSGRPLTNSGLANCGRIAGMGISYDNYGDESGCPDYDPKLVPHEIRFPNDNIKPHEQNGPLVIIQKGRT